MSDNFYTAREAAELLGLKYHTLLARAHKKPGKYPHEKIGWAMVFHKEAIDKAVKNATTRKAVAGAAR